CVFGFFSKKSNRQVVPESSRSCNSSILAAFKMCAVQQIRVSVIAPNSRRTTEIRLKNRDVLLAKSVLVSILLLVAGLSARSQSAQSKSGQWRIAGQNLNNT